jgi:hypothetical protein
MTFLRVSCALALGLSAFALAACEPPDLAPPPVQPTTEPPPPAPPPAAQPLGVVDVQAGNVTVNGVAITGSRQLFENDKVTTGSNGWARIRFNAGGTLTMEPNSDPTLRLISQAGCVTGQLVVRLWYGTFTAQGVTDVCFDIPTHQATLQPQSDFRIEITNDFLSLTVTSGQVLVLTGPARLSPHVVPAGSGIVVTRGETEGPRQTIR